MTLKTFPNHKNWFKCGGIKSDPELHYEEIDTELGTLVFRKKQN